MRNFPAICAIVLAASCLPHSLTLAAGSSCFLVGQYSYGAYACECPTIETDPKQEKGSVVTSRRLKCDSDGQWTDAGKCVYETFGQIGAGRKFFTEVAGAYCGVSD